MQATGRADVKREEMRGAEVEEDTTAAGSRPHLDLVLLPSYQFHYIELHLFSIIQIVRPQILIIAQQVS